MQQAVQAVDFTSFVFAQGDDIKTTSLLVAEKFGKRHDNIIAKIKSLDCSEGFTLLNFKECFRINELANNKQEPFYEMTKDGFMFLVMGFTGKAAAQIKEAYINAFNLMHAKLFPKTPYGLKELPPAYLNHDMKRHIQELVNAQKVTTGKTHQTIYHDLKTHFQTSTYAEIPIVKYADVCAWFGAKPKHDLPQMVSIDVKYLEVLRQKHSIKVTQLEEGEMALPEKRYLELIQAEKNLSNIVAIDGADVAFLRIARDMISDMVVRAKK